MSPVLMDDLIIAQDENQLNENQLNVALRNEDKQEGIEKRIAITYALRGGHE